MKVVVIGGGFAGLSAAIHLQERRHEVVLLERRGVLGGRASSYADAWSGEAVDNGTHLMIAAYEATLDLLRRASAEALVTIQDRLRIEYADDQGRSVLACPRWPAPWHLFGGLLRQRLPWSVRWQALKLGATLRFSGARPGESLAELFTRTGQGAAARRLLWDPLATAILNETPERAAASLFARVFRDAFLSHSGAARLAFLRCGFAELHGRLSDYFERRGGRLLRRARAASIGLRDGRAASVTYQQAPSDRASIRAGERGGLAQVEADAIVAAVPWYALPELLPPEWRERPPFAGLERLGSSPIVSVELWLDRPALDVAMLGLRDSEMEWVFDKGRLFGRTGAPQHLGFIVSAAHRSAARRNAELVAAAEAVLRRYLPGMTGAKVVRSLVLREQHATFACSAEAEALRPGPRSPIPGLLLAGDWTATGLPATIEGAVRSGRSAAHCLAELHEHRASARA